MENEPSIIIAPREETFDEEHAAEKSHENVGRKVGARPLMAEGQRGTRAVNERML